jgi:glycosyltransferase involved in cell wall biosynthesis
MSKLSAADGSFTVIIFTRNRIEQLRQTVECVLARLKDFPGARLLIVDNGSTDETGEYICGLAARHERVTTAYEPTPGLYFARLRGLTCSYGEFFVFLDDDTLPGDNWPEALIEELISDPQIGMVGAAIDPLWVGPRPDWFSDRLSDNVLSLRLPQRMLCRYPRYPVGGAMAGRRVPDIVDLYGSFERHELPVGWGAASKFGEVPGADWDLAELYIRNKFKVIQINRARVRHVALAHKLTPTWIYKNFQANGRLRIRYARLAGLPMFGARTVMQLLAFPALQMTAKVLQLTGWSGKRAVTIVAYAQRAQGMWTELLWGPRHIRYPFHTAELSARPISQTV